MKQTLPIWRMCLMLTAFILMSIIGFSQASISTCCSTTICEGDSVILTSSPGYGYLWSNGATTPSIVVYDSGDYTVTVTDADGNTSTSPAVTVTVNPLPVGSISPAGPITLCKGETTELTASGGVSYVWSNGATTSSITVDKTGSYYVEITNEFGCSVTLGPVEVTVNPKPLAYITAGDCNFCEGGSVTLTSSPGSSYLWNTGETTQSIEVTTSGSYEVTVTNAYGCSKTSNSVTVTVYENPEPVISADGPTEFCDGGSVTLTSSAAASYLWSTGETTQSITVDGTGCYSVTVTSEDGCEGSDTICVTEYPNPVCSIEGILEICTGECTTLTAPEGYTYSWSTGATTQSIEVCAGGIYSVTITDGNGCSSTCEVEVIEHEIPDVHIEADGPTEFCEGGSVVLTAHPNGPGYTYVWKFDDGSGWVVVGYDYWITATEPGLYHVRVTSEYGCESECEPIEIIVHENPVCAITGDLEICEGETTTLTASGGGTYLWNTGETTASIEVSTAGVYSVTVTNEYGCTSSCEVEVIVYDTPDPLVTADAPIPYCEGQIVTLCAEPDGLTYLWSTGETTQCIEVSIGGTYDVTVTNEYGCSASTDEDVTIFHPIPEDVEITIDGDTIICEGECATLTATAVGDGPFTYVWTTGETTESITVCDGGTYGVVVTTISGCAADTEYINIIESDIPVCSIEGDLEICTGECTTLTAPAGYSYSWSTGATTQSIEVCAGGVYSVTITNEYGCSSTCEVEVIEHENPVCSIDGDLEICTGECTTLTAPAGYSYVWSTGATTQSIEVCAGGVYSVTITNEYGCSSTCEVEVIEHEIPDVHIEADGPTEFCEGGSVVLTAHPNGPGYTYEWRFDDGSGWVTIGYDYWITATEPGLYHVRVTSEYGCESECEPIEIIVHENPVCSIDGILEFCEGGSTTLTASGGGTYLWNTGETTASIVVTTAGVYSVTVTNEYGCTSSCEVAVTVNPNPVCSIDGDLEICTGECTTLTAPEGYTYSWSTGATTQSIEVCAGGVYSVTITNEYGCSSTCEVEVIEHEIPDVHIEADGPTEFCEGGSVVLTAHPNGPGYTYEWRYNDGSGWVTIGYDYWITATEPGLYHVRVTSEYGCESECEPIEIIVHENPVCLIEGDLEICTGECTTLTAPAGYSYVWSTGATTQSIEVCAGGVYSVTITNEYGCSSTCEVEVIEHENPDPVIVINCYTTICEGTVATLTSTPASSYLWNTGETTQSIEVTDAGTYYVTVTNEYGCTGTSNSIVITVIPTPEASITPEGITEVCRKTSVTYCANDGVGLTYQWYRDGVIIPGATGMCYTAYAAGDYQVKVTNENGCSAWSGIGTLSVLPDPEVKIKAPNGLDLCCLGSVELTAKDVPGYTYQWYKDGVAIPGATGTVYYATEVGLYYYRAWTPDGCSRRSKYKVISCGCGREADVNGTEILNSWIEVFPNPTSDLTNVKFALKDAQASVTLQITSVEGQLVYQESFNDGDDIKFTTLDLGDLAKGIYFITITSDSERMTEKLIVN